MRAILISIKPKYVAKILNSKKTIEIRKTMPKCDLPIDVYIYATKDKELDLVDYRGCDMYGDFRLLGYGNKLTSDDNQPRLNGKVVAKFTLNNVEEWHSFSWHFGTCYGCVSYEELCNYSKGVKSLYYWFIDNLVIFDEPRELSEFKIHCDFKCPKFGCCYCHKNTRLTKAPQSWCYIEVLL